MKEFSFKQVVILVLGVVAVISFLETSAPLWTISFLRQFVLKFVVYGLAVELLLVGWAGFRQ